LTSKEATPSIKGRLVRSRVIVTGSESEIKELMENGFGFMEGGKLALEDFEALYLLFSKRISVVNYKGEELTFEKLLSQLVKKNANVWTKFLVYRDLRQRGFVVREGFGVGVDLRVYERGDYTKKPAKYVVFAFNEGETRSFKELLSKCRTVEMMGKEGIVAVIERRGEIVYYKTSRAVFPRNE